MRLKEKTRDSTNFSKDNVTIESLTMTNESLTNTTKVKATTRKTEKKPHSERKGSRRIDVITTKDAGQEIRKTTTAISLLNWVGKVTGLTMI